MELSDLKQSLYKERQIVDAVSTTVKQNVSAILAILASIAIPLVPAIFSANGVMTLTPDWNNDWRMVASVSIAIAVEGAGMFLSLLATKTYSGWRKRVATAYEILAMAFSVVVYTAIVIALISFSDIPEELKWIVGGIPLLGIAFYIGLGYDVDLTNRLDEKAAEKLERRQRKAVQTMSDNVQTRVLPKSERLDIVQTMVISGRHKSDIAAELGVSVKTIERDIKSLNGNLK